MSSNPVGHIGLIQQLEDGRVVQIGITREQSVKLQIFLASLSADRNFVIRNEKHDLVLKSEVKSLKKHKKP